MIRHSGWTHSLTGNCGACVQVVAGTVTEDEGDRASSGGVPGESKWPFKKKSLPHRDPTDQVRVSGSPALAARPTFVKAFGPVAV